MRIAVAAEHELKPGEMKRVSLDGKRLLLANAEGQYFFVDASFLSTLSRSKDKGVHLVSVPLFASKV